MTPRQSSRLDGQSGPTGCSGPSSSPYPVSSIGEVKTPPRANSAKSNQLTEVKPRSTDVPGADRPSVGIREKARMERAMKSAGAWEKWWWKKVLPVCTRCSRSCKQSDKVILVYCREYAKDRGAD